MLESALNPAVAVESPGSIGFFASRLVPTVVHPMVSCSADDPSFVHSVQWVDEVSRKTIVHFDRNPSPQTVPCMAGTKVQNQGLQPKSKRLHQRCQQHSMSA
jgi:hypothetical protein